MNTNQSNRTGPDKEPFTDGQTIIINVEPGEQACLHESCSLCGGTGIRKDGLGMCIHHISCPCPKCTPRC